MTEEEYIKKHQETSALYREHKGSLSKSLETVISVSSLSDIKALYDKDDLMYICTEYQCKYHGEDRRIEGWEKTYIVDALCNGVRTPLGFCNKMLY